MYTVTVTSKAEYSTVMASLKAAKHQLVHDHTAEQPIKDAKGEITGWEREGELIIEDHPDTTPLPVSHPKQDYAKLLTLEERVAFIAKHLNLT